MPRSAPQAIRDTDFVIGILNGSRGDIRVAYETGIAVGLKKPVLMLLTRNRSLPLEIGHFPFVRVSLGNRSALAFQLKLFLSTPSRNIFAEQPSHSVPAPIAPASIGIDEIRKRNSPHSALELRVFQIIEAGGGTAVAQPEIGGSKQYKPDLLAWLGLWEPELLDPAAVEVKQHVEEREVRKIEERLIRFMAATGVRASFVLTSTPPPQLDRPLSPTIFWLEVGEFEQLLLTSRLGFYVRDVRNRLVHGML